MSRIYHPGCAAVVLTALAPLSACLVEGDVGENVAACEVGRELWRTALGGTISEPLAVLADGSVAVVTDDGFVHLLDRDGGVVWQREVCGQNSAAVSVLPAGRLAVPSDCGSFDPATVQASGGARIDIIAPGGEWQWGESLTDEPSTTSSVAVGQSALHVSTVENPLLSFSSAGLPLAGVSGLVGHTGGMAAPLLQADGGIVLQTDICSEGGSSCVPALSRVDAAGLLAWEVPLGEAAFGSASLGPNDLILFAQVGMESETLGLSLEMPHALTALDGEGGTVWSVPVPIEEPPAATGDHVDLVVPSTIVSSAESLYSLVEYTRAPLGLTSPEEPESLHTLTLLALDSDGTLQWRLPLPTVPSVTSLPVVPDSNGALIAAPSISGAGRIYVGSPDGKVYVADPGGEVAWSADVRNAVRVPVALTKDRMLVATDDGVVHAIETCEPARDPSHAWPMLHHDAQNTNYQGTR